MFLRAINIILLLCLMGGTFLLRSSPGFAQAQYNIKEMTPQVQAALDARKSRFDQLRDLKNKGLVGENNHGYVEALSDDPSSKALVDAENKDRRFIYKTIEDQNNLTEAMDIIEEVFAQVQRDKANPGDKIQEDNGQWVNK